MVMVIVVIACGWLASCPDDGLGHIGIAPQFGRIDVARVYFRY